MTPLRVGWPRPRLAAVGVLVVTALAGADDEWSAPAAERARTNPVPATPEALAKGRALYQKHCAMCHGGKGKGDGPAAEMSPLPPHDLTDRALQERMTDGEILWKLTTGRKTAEEVAMPAMALKVPEENDRWKLVLFVRSLAK